MNLFISMPVRDDWQAALQLCVRIDRMLQQNPELRASIMMIDDGSNQAVSQQDVPSDLKSIQSIWVLELRRNLGHQRAIAIGLVHLVQTQRGDGMIVMDGDGEDRPEDIPVLIKAAQGVPGTAAVFAERGKRLETWIFRAFYQVYRVTHHVLTGRDMRFGNFSYLPWPFVETLSVFPELWNHYAATFVKSGLPYSRIKVDRAKRISGRSQMRFVDLFVHGLSALFANQEIVGTRLLVISFLAWVVSSFCVTAVIAIHFFRHFALSGWVGIALSVLILLASQAGIAAFVLMFLITMNRSQLGFLPVRDYSYFVRRESILFKR